MAFAEPTRLGSPFYPLTTRQASRNATDRSVAPPDGA